MEQIKIAYEFINKSLPVELLNFFKLNSEVHSYLTCNVVNNPFRRKIIEILCCSHLEQI